MTPTSSRSKVATLVLPVATAVVAIAIFIADTATGIAVAAAGLYVVVVLMAARFLNANGVILVGFGCMGLTGLSYVLSPPATGNPAETAIPADLSRSYRLDDLSRRADPESRGGAARAGQPPQSDA